jgi:RNA-binding protein 8A
LGFGVYINLIKEREANNKMQRREHHEEYSIIERSYKGTKGIFQMIDQEKGPGPGKSVEGYIIFIRNLNEEVQEDNIHDLLSKFGKIKNLHLNLDKHSGYAKGYCLVQFEKFDKAEKAIKFLKGRDFLGTTLDGNFTRNAL